MPTQMHGIEVFISRLEEDDVKDLPSGHHIKKNHVGLWHAAVFPSAGPMETVECLATGIPNKSRRLAIRSAMKSYFAQYCED